MKSVEKLQEMLNKELELVKQHKKKANDLKKQIEIAKQSELSTLVNDLDLSDAEYFHFKKLLKNKDSFLATIDVIKQNNEDIVPGEYDPTDDASIEVDFVEEGDKDDTEDEG